MTKRALVIGGNGFIGCHVVQELLGNGWDVTVYDRAADDRPGQQAQGRSYVRGELGNRKLLRSCVEGCDVVFHLAYTTIPKTSNDDPTHDVESNVCATLDLLKECVEANVERVVFLSSGGTVYGIPQSFPVSEDHTTEPLCSYGISKLTIERYLHLFHYLHGLRYVVLRASNPYGEEQSLLGEQGAIGVFLGRIHQGHPIVIWGDGSVTRDYFYVGDLARACRLAADAADPALVVNIGSGEGVSLNDLLRIFRDELGLEFETRYEAGRPFDVPRLVLDPSKARQTLGWEPEVGLADGLRRTWKWVQDQ